MNRIQQALLLAGGLLAVALLAMFEIVPAAFAQYAPLAVVPFIVSRQPLCCTSGKGARL